jgi:peptidoglycan-associated lipoprotein
MRNTTMTELRRHALGPIFLGLSLATLMLSGCAHKQKKRGGEDELASYGRGDGDEKLPPCAVRVHFDYDSTVIPERDRPALTSSAGCMMEDRTLSVMVEGNADERGTEEYNLALGDRRANTVAKYLQSLGAYESQLRTVSYGEENPVCGDHQEDCWQKNRRAAVRPKNLAGPRGQLPGETKGDK